MELRWLDFSNQPIKAIETSTQAHVFLLSIFWVDTNIFLSYTDKPVKLVRSQTTSLNPFPYFFDSFSGWKGNEVVLANRSALAPVQVEI